MKSVLPVVRVLATILCGPMLVLGFIWVLQGLNLLPGSFMTGHIEWTGYGALLMAAGAAIVWWLNRRRR